MKLVFGKNKLDLTYWLLCVSIVGIAVNYSIIGPLRVTDIFLLLAFISIVLTGSIKKDIFWVIVSILAFLILSLIIGVWKMGIRQPNNLFFIYKFIFPFLPAIIMYSLSWDLKRLKRIHRLSFYTFIFLTAWVYIYMVLKFLGMPGNWRPKWPFSSETWGSDAHLYSAYLGTGLIFLRMYWRKVFGLSSVAVNLISVLSIAGLFLTGSRTGVVILFAYTFSKLIRIKRIKLKFHRKYLILVPVVLSLVFVSVFALGSLNPETKEQFRLIQTVSRTIKFDLGEDNSANARVVKFFSSFQQSAKTNFFFGPGALAMRGNWYDGYIPQVNVLMGGLGLIYMLILPFAIVFKHYKKAIANQRTYEFKVFAVVLGLYFLANLITEYFLVTRSVAPVSVFLTTLSLVIYKQSESPVKRDT